LQSRSSEVFQTDINPAARIGKGIFLDHATGLVVGETAVVGDNVSMLQDVTLGGTGKAGGDRHPKVRDCVLIGAGAKVLGNIEIGSCARIAAGSVVLHEVPPRTTVAGVPAKIVGEAGCPEPGLTMDQLLQKVEELGA
jgi:serine O-acetyltransferase